MLLFSLVHSFAFVDDVNIKWQITRRGRRVEISIFDIVVGDVIPLKIGDQVNS